MAETATITSAKNQVLILLTDGGFNYPWIAEGITARLKQKGVFVVLFRVGYAQPNDKPKAYNKIVTTRKFSDVTANMAEIVKTMQLEVIRKVKTSMY